MSDITIILFFLNVFGNFVVEVCFLTTCVGKWPLLPAYEALLMVSTVLPVRQFSSAVPSRSRVVL